jgi:hypothetical protein
MRIIRIRIEATKLLIYMIKGINDQRVSKGIRKQGLIVQHVALKQHKELDI